MSDILQNEDMLLRGMLAAAEDRESETATIEIARKKKVLFAFQVRSLSESEINKCLDQAAKYVTKRGVRIQEDVDQAKYRSLLIYNATLPEDRVKTWDNKALWDSLGNIITGHQVIDRVLHPAEKEAVIFRINQISGYGDEDDEAETLEDTAKN